MNRMKQLIAASVLHVIAVGHAPAQRTASADVDLPRRIQFGATLAEVSDSMRTAGNAAGALVLALIPHSAAALADVRVGDIIVRIADDTVENVAGALSALRPLPPGRNTGVEVMRGGRPVTLTFQTRERPRETSPDFLIDYRAVDARGGRHRVLVSHPSDSVPHPAVLMIGGIGCYSIDQPSGANPYRDLAYHLTRRGYTVLRVEKLGIGDSDGSACLNTDFETEVDGYRQALSALRSYPSVDTTRVFLFGHSIGGIEAPLLASESGVDHAIAGVAVLSTTGVAWYEYELANLRRQLRLSGLAPDSVERYMRLKTICAFQFLEMKETRAAIVAHDSACAPELAYPASDAYMHAVAELPPAKVWRGVHAPVLVMYGASDFVTSRSEHVMLTEDINAVHPDSATYAEIAELDHYLSRQASQKASQSDPVPGLSRPYYGVTIEPVLDGWLAARSRRH